MRIPSLLLLAATASPSLAVQSGSSGWSCTETTAAYLIQSSQPAAQGQDGSGFTSQNVPEFSPPYGSVYETWYFTPTDRALAIAGKSSSGGCYGGSVSTNVNLQGGAPISGLVAHGSAKRTRQFQYTYTPDQGTSNTGCARVIALVKVYDNFIDVRTAASNTYQIHGKAKVEALGHTVDAEVAATFGIDGDASNMSVSLSYGPIGISFPLPGILPPELPIGFEYGTVEEHFCQNEVSFTRLTWPTDASTLDDTRVGIFGFSVLLEAQSSATLTLDSSWSIQTSRGKLATASEARYSVELSTCGQPPAPVEPGGGEPGGGQGVD